MDQYSHERNIMGGLRLRMGRRICSAVLLSSSADTFGKEISCLLSLTTPSLLTSSLFVFSSSETSCSPASVKSLIETVLSRPFDNFTCAYWGLAWRSSASSTSELYLLFWTCFLTNILPCSLIWEGTACSVADFL